MLLGSLDTKIVTLPNVVNSMCVSWGGGGGGGGGWNLYAEERSQCNMICKSK